MFEKKISSISLINVIQIWPGELSNLKLKDIEKISELLSIDLFDGQGDSSL